MFTRSIRLFRILGFDVGAHWSLFVALALAALSYGGLPGALLSAAIFASVLLHELGHAVVARRRGVAIEGTDLHFFGGQAVMRTPPRSPKDEVAIAIAGPLVSLALGVALVAAAKVAGAGFLGWLGATNLVLFAFNMLPALPMDGGRVLRAVLANRRGLVEGTRISTTIGRGIAAAMFVAGLVWQPTLCALAVLVWMMAGAELRSVLAHNHLHRWGFATPWSRYDRATGR